MPNTRRSLTKYTRSRSMESEARELKLLNDTGISKQSTPASKRSRKNKRLSSDSNTENETSVKKSKVEKSPELETPKRGRTRKSIVKKAEDTLNVKEEASEIKENVSLFVGLSEYELQIQKNIQERAKFMESLNILAAKENLLELTPKSVKKEYRGYAKEARTPVKHEKTRRSLRQQRMTPDGAHLALPSDKEVALAESTDEVRSRPPAGPAPLMDYYQRNNKEECQDFLGDLSKIGGSTGSQSVWSGSLAKVVQVMKSLKIDDSHVAKVTPQRTFSIQVHPSEEKTLVLIGGKWGELGVWDVERADESVGAYYFNVHSRPINCLTLQSSKPELVYTTSYDGTVRRTDLVSGIVQEVYSYCDAEIYNQYISWHAHQDENCLLVASNEGLAVHVDMREPTAKAKNYVVHKKSVKVVTVHPTRNTYFATSSMNSVRLWDMRKLKKLSPIAEEMHGKVVNGLEFSPLTGNSLVSTSKDNYLRILSCDLSSLKTTTKIAHNNHTGRWLTGFKARFVPNREDLIIVGSMKYPRRMEVFDTDGKLQVELMGESLSSVTSITAVHPTRPIIAGSNSSGKAFAFTTSV